MPASIDTSAIVVPRATVSCQVLALHHLYNVRMRSTPGMCAQDCILSGSCPQQCLVRPLRKEYMGESKLTVVPVQTMQEAVVVGKCDCALLPATSLAPCPCRAMFLELAAARAAADAASTARNPTDAVLQPSAVPCAAVAAANCAPAVQQPARPLQPALLEGVMCRSCGENCPVYCSRTAVASPIPSEAVEYQGQFGSFKVCV